MDTTLTKILKGVGKVLLSLAVSLVYLGMSENGDIALLIFLAGLYFEFRLLNKLNRLWELANE